MAAKWISSITVILLFIVAWFTAMLLSPTKASPWAWWEVVAFIFLGITSWFFLFRWIQIIVGHFWKDRKSTRQLFAIKNILSHELIVDPESGLPIVFKTLRGVTLALQKYNNADLQAVEVKISEY